MAVTFLGLRNVLPGIKVTDTLLSIFLLMLNSSVYIVSIYV